MFNLAFIVVSNFHYTRFIVNNSLSGVTSKLSPFPWYCSRPALQVVAVASRWQCVGDLIGSGFEPHTFLSRKADVLVWLLL